ncbi:MBOAT family O-acyltransferase [Acetivibrio mesophilus]|uniref:hypothetical protein n=1 Tax=Acetivibrio mesophilus TaxID=2487273 RepID=UPI001F364E23|nr:hypothetical protein [Acetivibrio mesophilus]
MGWVFFYHTDINEAFQFIGIMFGINASSWWSPEISIFLKNYMVFIVISLIACTPVAKVLFDRIKEVLSKKQIGVYTVDQLIKSTVNIAILILSIVLMVGQSYNPFLYFKF